MKLSKIIVAVLALLLAGASIMSIVSIVNIGNSFIKDDNGTSSDKPSGSTNKPAEPEAPEESENYLEGSVVKTAPDYTGSLSGYYKLNTGRAFVRESNGIIYCYIKFVIPSGMKFLYVNYFNLELGNSISSVYRYSYDASTWYLLDEKRYDYSSSTGWNGANVPKNNAEFIYVSFYTLSASKYTLETALEMFENSILESCNFYILNQMG